MWYLVLSQGHTCGPFSALITRHSLIDSVNNYISSLNVIHSATVKEDTQQLMSFATQFREIFFFESNCRSCITG